MKPVDLDELYWFSPDQRFDVSTMIDGNNKHVVEDHLIKYTFFTWCGLEKIHEKFKLVHLVLVFKNY